MTSVADLEAQRAALVAARNTGALRTTFRDGGTERTTWFKSDAEMVAAIADIDRQIARTAGRRVTTFLPTFSKGL